jgi:hypothetical protein
MCLMITIIIIPRILMTWVSKVIKYLFIYLFIIHCLFFPHSRNFLFLALTIGSGCYSWVKYVSWYPLLACFVSFLFFLFVCFFVCFFFVFLFCVFFVLFCFFIYLFFFVFCFCFFIFCFCFFIYDIINK